MSNHGQEGALFPTPLYQHGPRPPGQNWDHRGRAPGPRGQAFQRWETANKQRPEQPSK